MFETWGRTAYRRRWLVLAIALAGVVIAAVWGTRVFGALKSSGGFTAPDSQSQRASDLAASTFGRDDADVVVLYRSATLTVNDPRYRAAVMGALASLPAGTVTSESTYWSTGAARFVSADHRATYAVLQLAGADDAARIKSYDAISGHLGAAGSRGMTGHGGLGCPQGAPCHPGLALQTQTGGTITTEKSINKQVTADIGRAEGLSMPVLLILLLVIFGGLAAASLPLAIGGIAILGSFAALRLLTLVTDVSVYSINITTILGLGLAIDYGLFMVGRFREELRRQATVEDAVARTVATAGRTVAVDLLAALTVMPALLAVLGHRVNALRVRRSLRRPAADSRGGAWYRIAGSVMRRPVVYVVVIVAGLVTLGAPFLSVSWGGTDARVLSASAQPRQVTEALNRDFPANATSPIEAMVVLPRPAGPATAGTASTGGAGQAVLTAYAGRLAAVPGVTSVQLTGVRGNVARFDLGYQPDPRSTQARDIAARVRAVPAPPGATVYIGGVTAQLVDLLHSLGQTLPWMALVVGLATFVLLFLAFGSVVLPVKAIEMNVLSLTATFGAIVWIFQEGHLSGLLHFTPTGTIDPTMPILMLAIIFGLSMDYEVFLLSRIRERYDLTGDNTASVAGGLQRTGGIITSLALLLVIVVGAFSASGITFIKLMGVGMIVALVIDATVVRVLLVPATMRLLGGANWWLPRPLRRVYARYGIRDEDSLPQPVPEPAGT